MKSHFTVTFGKCLAERFSINACNTVNSYRFAWIWQHLVIKANIVMYFVWTKHCAVKWLQLMWCMGWQCKQENAIFLCHTDDWDWQVGLMIDCLRNQENWVFHTRPFTCDKMLQIVNKEPLIWPACWVCTSCRSTNPHVVLEMHTWKYKHLRNIVTNGIYSNSNCDSFSLSPLKSHSKLFDSFSINNFGRNMNNWITSLI